jgi:hypothetical protein
VVVASDERLASKVRARVRTAVLNWRRAVKRGAARDGAWVARRQRTEDVWTNPAGFMDAIDFGGALNAALYALPIKDRHMAMRRAAGAKIDDLAVHYHISTRTVLRRLEAITTVLGRALDGYTIPEGI